MRDCSESKQSTSCDQVVRDLCKKELSAVRKAMPRAVVVVVDRSGKETLSFTLAIDGESYEGRLDRAVALDPGEHLLRVGLGDEEQETRIVLREGEGERRVEVSFAPEAPSSSPVPLAPVASPMPMPDEGVGETGLTGVQVGGIVLGSVGFVGMVVGGVLMGTAVSKNNEANEVCREHACQENSDEFKVAGEKQATARTLAAAGATTLAVGGVAAAAGVLMFLLGGSSEPEQVAEVSIVIGPAFVGMNGTW